MNLDFTNLSATAVAAAVAIGGGVATGSQDDGGLDDVAVVAATPCEPLDPDLLSIDVQATGHLTLVYAGDEYATCNEWMVITSYASTGPAVDNTDPIIDQIVFHVADLEAAGAAGVTVERELDPCWAGLEVHRDGDTLLWSHVLGDGCPGWSARLGADAREHGQSHGRAAGRRPPRR